MNNINITRNGNDYMTLVSSKYKCGTNTRGSARILRMSGYKMQRVGYFTCDNDEQAVLEYVMLNMPRAENITIRGVNNPRSETDNTSFYVVTYNEAR
jgi:hypothetical protein